MKKLKRNYLVEDKVSFRPSPYTMRQLEELWEAWDTTRSEVMHRAINFTYLLWKNGWIMSPQETKSNEFKPLKVIES